jgi:hypothetical protein
MQRKTILLSSFLIFTLIGVAFFVSRQSGSISAETDQPSVPVLPDNSEKSADTALSNEISLPGSDIPLRDAFPALKAAADGGHVKASCRIGIELARCKSLKANAKQTSNKMHEIEMQIEKESDKGFEAANNFAEAEIARLGHENEMCSGFDANELAMASKYLRQAALAGDPDAAIAYINGQAYGSDQQLSLLQDKGFRDWQNDAQRIAENSVVAGVPEAVILLHKAYSRDDTSFSALVVNDPEKALMYEFLVSELIGRPAKEKTGYSLKVNSEAMQQARAMHTKHFKNRIFSYRELTRRVQLPSFGGDSGKTFCE